MSPSQPNPVRFNPNYPAVLRPTSPAAAARIPPQSADNSDSPGAVVRQRYGLPCAKCRTYYSSDQPCCPVCKNGNRLVPAGSRAVAPPSPAPTPSVPPLDPNVVPDLKTIERERERFVQEFRARMQAARAQAKADRAPAHNLVVNHRVASSPAKVCHECHHLRDRVDLMETALQIDMKDAAQIVYDAVWSTPSDGNKSYENAAKALLTELRKRAGILAPLPSRPEQRVRSVF